MSDILRNFRPCVPQGFHSREHDQLTQFSRVFVAATPEKLKGGAKEANLEAEVKTYILPEELRVHAPQERVVKALL